jgi:hypothetical protein
LDPGVCWLTTFALSKVMERGTGSTVKTEGFSKPCAGKTGYDRTTMLTPGS